MKSLICVLNSLKLVAAINSNLKVHACTYVGFGTDPLKDPAWKNGDLIRAYTPNGMVYFESGGMNTCTYVRKFAIVFQSRNIQ